MIITLFMLGFWLDHYEDRLSQATNPAEIQFLEEQLRYYRIRYNNFLY